MRISESDKTNYAAFPSRLSQASSDYSDFDESSTDWKTKYNKVLCKLTKSIALNSELLAKLKDL